MIIDYSLKSNLKNNTILVPGFVFFPCYDVDVATSASEHQKKYYI